MVTYIYVALGSALGGTLRYWVGGLIIARAGQTFPWDTLAINVSGSFVIGLFATLTEPDGRLFVPAEWRQFVMIGVCGGYTTFSSFSQQTLLLAHDGEWLPAAAYILLSVALCLLGVWLGHAGGIALNR